MKKRLYFAKGGERCYQLGVHIENLIESGLEEIELYRGKPDIGGDYFYCEHFDTCGEKGSGCGKECEAYAPRNGRNGACRFRCFTYEPADEKLIIKRSDYLIIKDNQ